MDPLIATVLFLFGLMFGSFLNVCIYRIPLVLLQDLPDEPVLRSTLTNIGAWKAVCVPARSFCPNCQRMIRWYDNIPVVSWLVLRGRCRDCGTRIRMRYAGVELLTATLFLACYAQFGLSLETLKLCALSFLLVALIFTDAEHRLLPDAFTIPGIVAGLLFSLAVPLEDSASRLAAGLLGSSSSRAWLSLLDSLFAAAVGAGFILGAGLMYKLFRGHEGMGLGDVKLMAMIGAFVGLKLTLLTIFGGSILGSVFGGLMVCLVWIKRWRRRTRRHGESGLTACRRAWVSAKVVRFYALPFGVFLGTAALLAVFFGDPLLRWYLGNL